jgi:type IV secretory pathway TrbL component
MLGMSFITDMLPFMKVFGFLKMARVFRLGTIIAKSNIDKNLKAILNLLKLLFYLGIFLHTVGCFLYIVVAANKDVEIDGV